MTYTKGTYGAKIVARKDGEYDLYLTYNHTGIPDENGSTCDVWSRKTYKSRAMAEKKIAYYFADQAA